MLVEHGRPCAGLFSFQAKTMCQTRPLLHTTPREQQAVVERRFASRACLVAILCNAPSTGGRVAMMTKLRSTYQQYACVCVCIGQGRIAK